MAETERRIAVRGVIVKDGKIFAVKHKTAEGGVANFWAIPGGGLDPGESLIDGVIRELVEEIGVIPDVGKLLYVQQYAEDKEFLEFFFEVKNCDHYEVIDLASTSHGEIEIARYGFIDPKKERLLPAFFQDIDLENQQTTRVFSYLKEEQ